jgi:hypothetical protein
VLFGDSIFDNGAYTRGAPDVITHLRAVLPQAWRATLCAVDGSKTSGLATQLRHLPTDATHLIVAVGGNDALGSIDLLSVRATSSAELLGAFAAPSLRCAHAHRPEPRFQLHSRPPRQRLPFKSRHRKCLGTGIDTHGKASRRGTSDARERLSVSDRNRSRSRSRFHRPTSSMGSGEGSHKLSYFPNHVGLPGHEQVVAHAWPSKDARAGHATFKRPGLSLSHRLVEFLKRLVWRCGANVVWTREDR